jgi:hypothetical protein
MVNPHPKNFMIRTQPKAAQAVSIELIAETATPEPTATHYPLAHIDFIDEVIRQLGLAHYDIQQATHKLTLDGSRYFGVLDLKSTEKRDYGFTVGLRNSHDKSFAAAVAAGNRVFVCDNLCFYGEIHLERKHTRFVRRDLEHLTARVIGQLAPLFGHAEHRIETYRGTELQAMESDHLILESLRTRAITAREVDAVLHAYDKPEHEEFQPRNAWSLFNAVTGVHRLIQDNRTLVNRSQALHGVFDGFCGVRLFDNV